MCSKCLNKLWHDQLRMLEKIHAEMAEPWSSYNLCLLVVGKDPTFERLMIAEEINAMRDLMGYNRLF